MTFFIKQYQWHAAIEFPSHDNRNEVEHMTPLASASATYDYGVTVMIQDNDALTGTSNGKKSYNTSK